jgi:hypothetical protein
MNEHFDHQNGRPTKQEEIEISEKLRPYYEKGFSAAYTSRETGFNVKTVLSHFDEWNKKLLESSEGDFLNRCKVEKEKGILVLESEIESLNNQELEVDEMIQAFKKVDDYGKIEHYSKLKLKIKELKAKFLGDKINLISTPTFDTILELSSRGMRDNKN